MNLSIRIAKNLLALAKALLGAKEDYIYDPEHKKHPGGGYTKTPRGWTLKKKPRPMRKQSPARIETTRKTEIANDPQTPPEVLEALSKDKNVRVRARVALNNKTPLETLKELSTDNQRIVRAAVARNERTTSKMLRTLAQDKSVLVRKEVAGNQKTPVGVLKQMHNGLTPEAAAIVYKEARKNLKSRLPKFDRNVDKKALKESISKLEDEKEEVLTTLKAFKKTLGPRGQGRNEAQLKADFIKNMNPSAYGSVEVFNAAKRRVSQMSVKDFAIMLNSILLDDEDEEIK